MKRSTLVIVSRRALQLATLLLAATPVTFGGEPVTSVGDGPLIGAMVVTATPERPLIGHMIVTASRLAPADALVADLGAMTVTASRITSVVRNDAAKVETTTL